MTETNKTTLTRANAFVAKGEYENFLEYCTEDTVWEFIGDRILYGKDAVRAYMAAEYLQPPPFDVEELIAENDKVIAIGNISMNGVDYRYCDIWTFRDGKMAALKAFVIEGK